MKLKLKISGIIILLSLLADYFIFFNNSLPVFRAVLNSIFCLFIPGLLIFLNLRIKKIILWELVVYSAGLSIAFLTFGGLALNLILPAFHISQPLAQNTIMIALNSVIVLLLTTYLAFGRKIEVAALDNTKSIFNVFATIVPLTLPILSVFGAILLNNSGSNVLTFNMLLGISAYVLFTILFRSRISSNAHITGLYCSALALLFMYSLRSNYLVGWDIQSEYRIFLLTFDKLFWSVQNINHTYNTTLSVTILPTVLSQITGIAPLYVFKFLYPIVFALSVPTIFLALRNITSKAVALLSTFFFIAQTSFMQQMPALARQEIALLFFTLSLLVMFTQSMNILTRRILFIVFGLSLIVSHYSTAYITIALYIATYAIILILKLIHKVLKVFPDIRGFLNIATVTILTVFTVFWYGYYTGTASYLSDFSRQVISNFSKIYTEEGKSESARVAILGINDIYTKSDLDNYASGISEEYHNSRKWLTYYPSEVYKQFVAIPKYPQVKPIRNYQLLRTLYMFFQIDQKLIKFTMAITITVLSILFLMKKRRIIPDEFLIFSWVLLTYILVITVVPYISVNYNIERLYQQTLPVLGYFAVIGLISPFKFKFVNKSAGYIIVSFLFVLYFYGYSGVLGYFFGGLSNMNLDNFGEEYERFYIHQSEKESAHWLSTHAYEKPVIFSDYYGLIRLQSNTTFTNGLLSDVYPGILDKYAYVYGTYAHMVNENTRVIYKQKSMVYNYPKAFLNGNKNLIYSSGTSVVYK